MAKRTNDTAAAVIATREEYIVAKANADQANAASEECWNMYSEEEIDGWSEEEFAEVSTVIERNCETIKFGAIERTAARNMVAACMKHVEAAAPTRRQYRANAAAMKLVADKWERLISIRTRMIDLCLSLDPNA
jgi:hypothetical protein